MKRSLSLACMLASTLGAGALAQSPAEPPSAPGTSTPGATASSSVPSKIAVIQFEGVVAQTNEGQRAFAELNAKYQPRQQQIQQQSQEIDTLKKQLQSAGETLSEADRQLRLRTIDDKEKALQRSVEDARNDFSTEMNEKFSAIAQKVAAVMAKYAQDNGYTLVLDAGSAQSQSPILWAAQSTNISEAIVQAYNKQSGVPPQPASAPAAPRPSTTTTTPRTPTHRTTTSH